MSLWGPWCFCSLAGFLVSPNSPRLRVTVDPTSLLEVFWGVGEASWLLFGVGGGGGDGGLFGCEIVVSGFG